MPNLSSADLVHIRLELEDRTWRRASVFPAFSQSGGVLAYLVVTRDELHVLPHQWRMRVQNTGRGVRIAVQDAKLVEAPGPIPGSQTPLFHFDPSWLLDRAPFRDNPAAQKLKATNRAPERIASVVFDGDLKEVRFLRGIAGSKLPVRALFGDEKIPRNRGRRRPVDIGKLLGVSPG